MRAPRKVIEAAIKAEGGNLSRVAALLGCSRPTLYTWIYQLGLQDLAGIRKDTINDVGWHSTNPKETTFSSDKSIGPGGPILRVVSTAPVDLRISATAKVRESVWKQIRKTAIDRGCTTSEVVEEALVNLLALSERRAEKKGGAS